MFLFGQEGGHGRFRFDAPGLGLIEEVSSQFPDQREATPPGQTLQA
jgi:hypothetical protein